MDLALTIDPATVQAIAGVLVTLLLSKATAIRRKKPALRKKQVQRKMRL